VAAPPVRPADVCFDADEARRQLLKEWQNVPALELTTNDYITCRVNSVDLKNRLGDVEADCRDRLHVWLLRIVRALNSTHIHGTSVPVEKPSTASIANVAASHSITLSARASTVAGISIRNDFAVLRFTRIGIASAASPVIRPVFHPSRFGPRSGRLAGRHQFGCCRS
jgi:hypothetical protein